MTRLCRCDASRVLFGLAGTLILASLVLGVTLSPRFLLVAAFVAVNQLVFAMAGACPASLLLRRACRTREAVR